MISDISAIAAGSALECDVCIIGAGVAGITLARELDGSGIKTVLLESGGDEWEEETQDLYAGPTTGQPYYDLDICRLRFLGGSSNHWGGWSRPLEPVDFEERAWVPESGWPITFEEFASYLPRASEVCEIAPGHFNSEQWLPEILAEHSALDQQGREKLKAWENALEVGAFEFSPPTMFGFSYRDILERSENVRTILHANATEFNFRRNSHNITDVTARNLEGHRISIKARTYVLAAGGIENARIMLAARKYHAHGMGNDHDLVGRYFSDHVELESGYILAPQAEPFFEIFAEQHGPARFSLDVKPEFQRDNRMVNLGFTLEKVPNFTRTSEGVGAARRLNDAWQRKEWPDNFLGDVGKFLGNLSDAVEYKQTVHDAKMPGVYMLINRLENAPNRDSRVTLARDKDALGMPRAAVHWELADIDYESVLTMQDQMARLLGAQGLGHMKIELDREEVKWPDVTYGGYHHMGTTRMSSDPKKGVVDADCRVHSVENLYVAGSSIFPTYGKANPTVNLAALAIRLADHLKNTRGGQA